MPPRTKPRVILFDIGGVCVVSPIAAINTYERDHHLPPGYINWTISQTAPNGTWQRLERGEIPLDASFYRAWAADLAHEARWRQFHARHLASQRKESLAAGAEEAAYQAPPPPVVDTEELHLTMMTHAQTLDPDMGPALRKLRAAADREPGRFVVAALSNTVIFPPGHPLHSPETASKRAPRGLEDVFDVFVSSAHEGLRKPDEAIYRVAVERVRGFVAAKGWGEVGTGDFVFLDDIGGNLRTARGLGMRTIKVGLGRVGEAVGELEGLTGLSLREEGGKSRL